MACASLLVHVLLSIVKKGDVLCHRMQWPVAEVRPVVDRTSAVGGGVDSAVRCLAMAGH
jgi:hypothetical protein